jgi:hypothetical protein
VKAPRLAALPALAAVLALVSGCGDLSGTVAQKDTAAAATASAAPAPESPPSTPAPAPSTLPPASGLPTPARAPHGPTRRVESSGISFEVPAGWLELNAADLAGGLGNSDLLAELADRSGLDPGQLVEMMGSIDLYLVSDDGAHAGFVDNINVIEQPVALQNDSQVELGLLTLGAKDIDVRHESTDAGDATVASYALDFSGRHAEATVIIVAAGEGTATVTISASEPPTLQGLVRTVLGSMRTTDAPIG